MKLFALALLTLSFSSMAAGVLSAKLDASKKNILVDVSYGGGCKKHTFSLELEGCMETSPVKCSAKLIESIEGGFDECEALLHETVVFNLKQYGLVGSYFSKGSLTITGDSYRGKVSSASVRLP